MSAKHVLVCWECGRPGELRDNETYCEHCGPGVEAVPDEAEHEKQDRLQAVQDKLIRELRRNNQEVIKRFLERLSIMSGTGNGIGAATVEKIRQFAIREGFLPKEEAAR